MTPRLPADTDPRAAALFTTRSVPRGAGDLAVRRARFPLLALMTIGVLGALTVGAADSYPEVARAAWFALLAVPFSILVVRAAPLRRYPATLLLGPAALLAAAGAVLHTVDLSLVAAPLLAAAATLAGFVLAASVTRLVWALPVLLVASIVDLLSVHGGPTGEWLAAAGIATTHTTVPTASGIIGHLSIVLATPGGYWVVGAVDVLAASLLAGLGDLYGLSGSRTAAGVTIALAATVLVPGGAPLLPLLVGAFALVHLPRISAALRFELGR